MKASLRFLLDQGVPRLAADELQARGYAAQHIGALGLATAADEDVLDEARKLGAVVVTLDADFHALLAAQRAAGPSVVRLRVEGLRSLAVADLLERVLAVAGHELRLGAVVSVSLTSVRVRLLPLV